MASELKISIFILWRQQIFGKLIVSLQMLINFLSNFDMFYLRIFSTNAVTTIFHFDKGIMAYFAIKGGMSIFHILRVFSMGHDFFSKLDSTFSSFASNISVVLSLFTLSFEYDVAETISYHKCAFIFRSDAEIMLIFHLQRGIWEFHFSFTCNRYGKCFGISVTHLTSDLEIPGSSPGVSNNLFLHFFFFFDFSMIINWKQTPNSSPWRIKCLVFISSVHFFVHTFTRNQHGQLPSNFCQSSSPMISSQISFFKVTRSSWRHPGAILWNHVIHHIFMMHKQRSFIVHITYTSGQGSTSHVIKGHMKVMTRTYARVKILKCSKSLNY